MVIDDYKELGEYGVKKLLQRGADFADFFFEKKFTFTAKFEDNKVENVSNGVDMGVGIRMIKKEKTYYGFTNDISKSSIDRIIDNLSVASNSEKEIVFGELERLDNRYPDVIEGNVDFDISAEEKIMLLRRANYKARECGDRIKQVTVLLKDSIQEVVIVNSLGNVVVDIRPRIVFYVIVVASDGRILQTGYEPIGHLGDYSLFNKVSPENIAFVAAERALKMLKAKPAPAGTFPVVISSKAGGTIIHEAVGHGLEADIANQELSVYSGKIGEKVASEKVKVIDDGAMKGKYGTGGYDDEGVPTSETVLIEDGILKGFMYDRLESIKAKTFESTGNGRRESYMHVPVPRMTNTYIAPGSDNPEYVIQDISRGIFVVKMGGGQVNTINGDFVFEISEGYMIENGEITYPIRGASLIGSGLEVLKNMDAVCDDIGFAIGTCGKDGQGVPVSDGLPTIRIKQLTVGGTKK